MVRYLDMCVSVVRWTIPNVLVVVVDLVRWRAEVVTSSEGVVILCQYVYMPYIQCQYVQ